MTSVGITLTTFLFVLTIIFGPILLVVWLVRGASREKSLGKDEAQLMQEIHRGLTRLDERLAALETLVLNNDSKKEDSHE